jgi:hypothetical protein
MYGVIYGEALYKAATWVDEIVLRCGSGMISFSFLGNEGHAQ